MNTLTTLILALMLVESGNDPAAIGDNGDAYGILQIHECVILDVNEEYGSTFVHNDAFDPLKSVEICKLYLLLYANERRLGHQPSYEEYSRIWNGGPNGYKRKATEGYWQKVKACLN